MREANQFKDDEQSKGSDTHTSCSHLEFLRSAHEYLGRQVILYLDLHQNDQGQLARHLLFMNNYS